MSKAGTETTLVKAAHNILKVLKEGMDMALNNPTKADVDKYNQDWDTLGKNTKTDILNRTYAEAKEGAIRRLTEGGMSYSAANAWFEKYWKRLLDSSEYARKHLPQAEEAGKHTWLKFVGGVTAIMAGGILWSAVSSGPSSQQTAMYNYVKGEAAEQQQMQQGVALSEDEFNIMTGGLLAQSAPPPTVNPTVAPPLEAALPAPIAAIAAEPAEVQVTTSSGTQEITTTVGQVYQNAPSQVRRVMQPEPTGFHKTFRVDSPIGSASFSY